MYDFIAYTCYGFIHKRIPFFSVFFVMRAIIQLDYASGYQFFIQQHKVHMFGLDLIEIAFVILSTHWLQQVQQPHLKMV